MEFSSCNEMVDGSNARTWSYWGCQDNAPSPVITSPNGREIPLIGNASANTEDISVDGPTPWIPRALRMRGLEAYGELLDGLGDGSDWSEFTILMRSKTLDQDGFPGGNTNAAPWRLRFTNLFDGFFRVVPVRQAYPSSLGWYRRLETNITFANEIAAPTWQHTAMRFSLDADTSDLWLDGNAVASAIASSVVLTESPFELRIGGTTSVGAYDLADMLFIRRHLEPSEIQEHIDGFEPLPLGSPSISGSAVVGETLTVNPAPWDNRNNGLLVRQWQWQRRLEGSPTWEDIDGATAANYTILIDDAGHQLRVAELAGNAGGVDDRQWVYSEFTDPAVITFSNTRRWGKLSRFQSRINMTGRF